MTKWTRKENWKINAEAEKICSLCYFHAVHLSLLSWRPSDSPGTAVRQMVPESLPAQVNVNTRTRTPFLKVYVLGVIV